jgi:hypothetical protein
VVPDTRMNVGYIVSVKKEIVNEKWHNGILMDRFFFCANSHKWGPHIHTVFSRQYEIVCIVAMVNSSIIVI